MSPRKQRNAAAAILPVVCKATVACADAGGGETTAALSVTLLDLNGAALASAVEVHLCANTVQYSYGPGAANGSLSLGTVTKGSIVATPSGGAAWLIRTNAAGEFVCVATNTDDETVYFVAKSASCQSSATYMAVVVASNCDGATWSA